MTARPTVLIVDDSAELRALVRARLEISGLFEVVDEAEDGGEAWTLADGLQPDLVLLDTSMPEMDGLEALPLILAVSPATQVVMFTGFGEAGLADRAEALGAVDFIEKSLPIDQLPERLWRHVADRFADGPPRNRGLSLVQGEDVDAVRAQAALDEHLERYREVFSQAAIGMATLTLNGSVVRTNKALTKLMRCEPRQLVGLDYGVLTEGRGVEFDAALREVADGKTELVTFEHTLTLEEKDPRTIRVSMVPVLDSRGSPLYVFAQVQDITADVALRRSEEMFRLLVTAVKDYAIYMLDADGNVATWNDGAENIKGYSAREIVGRHFRVFYPPEDRAEGHPEHNLALALQHGTYAEEGWRVRKDGSRFWASVVITALYDEAGRHLGFTKVTRDQTLQRDHEEERRRAVEQQAHLLAVTAHELRTPAAVIAGTVGLLREYSGDLDDPRRLQMLDALASSAVRLQRLVTDLGTASDVHADALALEPEPVWLRGMLLSAADRAHTAHPGVRISAEVAQDVEFMADPSRLGQALDNLLENAIRHGRPPIALVGEATRIGVRICVSDAGPGVDSRLVRRLFERFAHAGPNAGSGLGLHLVREIASSHGGRARYLRPHDDRRASFMIELPRRPRTPDL
ncbi:MAG TPA: PAS domain S-box protein [Nocardioides sp.]|nr:PAS domain S-box protein [Nocardioides sp.]